MLTDSEATREDRLVAALCHASAVYLFTGMLVPLIIWQSQKERSPFLRRQALQALIYQGIGTVAYGLAMFLLMLAYFFVMIPLIMADSGHFNPEGFQTIILILFSLIMLGGLFFSFIVVPIYYVFAVLGVVRNLQGRDFNYPLVGKWVRKPPPEPVTTAPSANSSETD